MSLRVEPLTPAAVLSVLGNLRDSDRAELAASGLDSVEEAFLWAAQVSDPAGVVLDGDDPVAIFGAHPWEDYGVAWMVGTDGIGRQPLAAGRLSRQVLRVMLDRHGKLHNMVHREHRTAIEWLRWLGANVDEAQTVGPGGAFHPFWITKET